MQIYLDDDDTAALTRLLTSTIDADRYPLSPRIQTLKAILGKIQPEPTPNRVIRERIHLLRCTLGDSSALVGNVRRARAYQIGRSGLR